MVDRVEQLSSWWIVAKIVKCNRMNMKRKFKVAERSTTLIINNHQSGHARWVSEMLKLWSFSENDESWALEHRWVVRSIVNYADLPFASSIMQFSHNNSRIYATKVIPALKPRNPFFNSKTTAADSFSDGVSYETFHVETWTFPPD